MDGAIEVFTVYYLIGTTNNEKKVRQNDDVNGLGE